MKVYGANRTVFMIYPKEEYTKKTALDEARKETHEREENLVVMCARRMKTKVEAYEVMTQRGEFWCVTRRRKDGESL